MSRIAGTGYRKLGFPLARFAREYPQWLSLDCVVDDVEPTQNAVKNHPQDGMIDTPRNGDGEHATKTPKTDPR